MAESILKKLANIFAIEMEGEVFIVNDAVDYYYFIPLTKGELLKLANEIETLANTMDNNNGS